MKSMPNTEERQQVIDRMVEILRKESPWLFGFFQEPTVCIMRGIAMHCRT
jgi:hypothetical protein